MSIGQTYTYLNQYPAFQYGKIGALMGGAFGLGSMYMADGYGDTFGKFLNIAFDLKGKPAPAYQRFIMKCKPLALGTLAGICIGGLAGSTVGAVYQIGRNFF